MASSAPHEPVSYATDVKPLFHERDRDSMTFAFDLWAFDDVAENAGIILKRLQAGTMPCYGAWPAANVDLFKRWVEGGKQP